MGEEGRGICATRPFGEGDGERRMADVGADPGPIARFSSPLIRAHRRPSAVERATVVRGRLPRQRARGWDRLQKACQPITSRCIYSRFVEQVVTRTMLVWMAGSSS